MATSLSNRADNLADGIHKIKYKDCDCFIEYESVKENVIKYKCLSCNKDYTNTIDEELKKRFKSTFKVSNNTIKKLILLLRKGVYSYEYMDDWKKVGETTSPEKEEFYSKLHMDNTKEADSMHAKRVCKDFEIKKFR